MGYRCANDIFNYCSGEPEWGERPETLGTGLYPGGGSCRLDPKTCGKHQSLREQVGDNTDRIKPAEGTHKPKKAKNFASDGPHTYWIKTADRRNAELAIRVTSAFLHYFASNLARASRA